MMKSIFSYNKNSLKLSYILNVVRLASAALVYIMTTPYINRILGAHYVGRVEYVYTIINYFLLFSALGIPMYGIREIAKNKNNEEAQAKTVVELFIILMATTVISYLIIFTVILNLGYFEDYRQLLLIFCCMIFLTNIGCEWYFQGIENHLFITIRYLCVRVFVVFFIFIFINTEQDYYNYAWSILLIGCGANLLNLYYIFKLIFRQNYRKIFSSLNIRKHLKPVFTIFVATLSINIYLQLDYLLIGYLTSDEYVGYYSVANKLLRFIISFITVIGVVALPRLSFLYHNNVDEYMSLLRRTFNYLFILSLPATVVFFIYASDIVEIIGGEKFTESILTMKLLSPLCVIVSMAYILGFLVLYPQNREKIYTFSVMFSAIFSLVVNYFAITTFKQNGAAVISVLAELIAVTIMYRYAIIHKMIPQLMDRNFFKILIAGLAMLLISYGLKRMTIDFLYIAISAIVSFGAYLVVLWSLKESEISQLFYSLKKKVK